MLKKVLEKRTFACANMIRAPSEGPDPAIEGAVRLKVKSAGKAAEKKEFVCNYPGCGKTFMRNIRLQAHMHMHYGTQPFRCKFANCNKGFAEKQNLLIHELIHKNLKPFSCSQCGKSFRTKGNMNDHERRHKKIK